MALFQFLFHCNRKYIYGLLQFQCYLFAFLLSQVYEKECCVFVFQDIHSIILQLPLCVHNLKLICYPELLCPAPYLHVVCCYLRYKGEEVVHPSPLGELF